MTYPEEWSYLTFDHLNLGSGWFSISEPQSVSAHPDLILQDKSTLRGRADFTCWQAAPGHRDWLDESDDNSINTQFVFLTRHWWAEAVPSEELCLLLLSASPWKSSVAPAKTEKQQPHRITSEFSQKSCHLHPHLVLGAVRPNAVNRCHGWISEHIPVSMSRQHSLEMQILHTSVMYTFITYICHFIGQQYTWNSPERPPLKPHGSGSLFIIWAEGWPWPPVGSTLEVSKTECLFPEEEDLNMQRLQGKMLVTSVVLFLILFYFSLFLNLGSCGWVSDRLT